MGRKYSDMQIRRELSNRRIELLETYKGMLLSHKLRYSTCGHEAEQVLNNVMNLKSSCPRCSGHTKHQLSHEEVKKRLSAIGIELMEPYKRMADLHLVRFSSCGHESLQAPNSLLNRTTAKSQGCPTCKASSKNSQSGHGTQDPN